MPLPLTTVLDPMSRAIAVSGIIIALVGCGAIPGRMATPNDAQVAHCSAMLGLPWGLARPPIDALELLAIPKFHPREKGVVWFSISAGRVAACAFTDDKQGCGFTTHEFMRVGDRWYYAPGPLLERICIVG